MSSFVSAMRRQIEAFSSSLAIWLFFSSTLMSVRQSLRSTESVSMASSGSASVVSSAESRP